MKNYVVSWTELHSAMVKAKSEEEAIGAARSLHTNETWDTFEEHDTNVYEVNEEGERFERAELDEGVTSDDFISELS